MDQYNITINEIKNIERDIRQFIKELKEKQEENTVQIETSIRKKLDEYSLKVVTLHNGNQNPKANTNM
jgi:hypothetical protein